MSDVDFILVSQTNVVDYEGFGDLPFDRLEIYKNLVYPRMVHHDGRFRSHLDYLNHSVHGKYYDQAGYDERRRMYNIWNLPSMAGVHLANYLHQFKIKTRVINNLDSEWDWFCQAYKSCRRPPLVGISSTFYLTWKEVKRVSQRLRTLDPDMDIVLGGAFTNSTFLADGVANFESKMRKYGIRYLQYAFHSEADLRDLLRARKANTGIDTVHNTVAIDGRLASGTFFATAEHWNKPVLDSPPTWDQLDLPFLNRTIQIRTATGCPFSCAFCSYPTTARSWDTIDANEVRAHLDAIMRIPNIDRIVFIDDTFNVPPHRFKALLRIFAEYPFEWFSFLRVQYADEEIIELMKDSGCRGVYLGIESASDKVLKNMNKKATKKDFSQGVQLLNKYDIDYLAAFVLGFPGETDETIQENINFINENDVRFYSLKEFYYMEQTQVHKRREEYGLTGMGNKWAHNTMTYNQAAEIKLDMFRQIDSSIHVDPDTSLWYLAYLYDQGHSFDEIRTLQTNINRLMKLQLASAGNGPT